MLVWLLLVAFLLAAGWDIQTTLRADAIETNPFARDKNRQFVLWKGITMKLFFAVALTSLRFIDDLLAAAFLGVSTMAQAFAALHNRKLARIR